MSFFFFFFSHLVMVLAVIITLFIHASLSGPLHSLVGDDTNNSAITTGLYQKSCRSKDISISQSRESNSGIPQYIVQIVNTCVLGSACSSPSDIRLHCGWFASARIVNPGMFKRLAYDDCLVNGGKALKRSQIVRFTYSNSFMYPLSFKSAKFC